MKALLIYPPNLHMVSTSSEEAALEEEGGRYPPLGLLYVAAYAEKYTDHTIEVLDARAEEMTLADVEQEIRRRQPDIVGIQSLTFMLIDVTRTANLVKKVSPEILVCLGGPHVNIFPVETVALPGVDVLVLGEGEIVFSQLLDALANGSDLRLIQGLVFQRDGEVINTGPPPLHEDLDLLPFPARHLISVGKYHSPLAKRSPITTLISSRGCPYRCSFCDRPHLGKRFRARSALDVVDEMAACLEDFGIRQFLLYDDTFTIKRQRVLDVADEILKRDLRIGWDVRARVNTVDREMLERLKAAGCERIHYGVEAGTPEILKVLRKDIDLDQVREAFRITREVGIETLAYFMIGSPTETREQILKTIDLAVELAPDYVNFSVTTPYPSTDLYRLGLQEGVLCRDYWREFAAHPTQDFTPHLWEENLTKDELMELMRYGYKRFYLRPDYVWTSLLHIQSLGELLRKAKMGLNILGW